MSSSADFETLYGKSKDLLQNNKPDEYESLLSQVLQKEAALDNDEAMRIKEQALNDLSEFYVEKNDSKKLQRLMELFLQLFNTFPKPKTAKIIKHLLDQGSRIEGDVSWQVDWCQRLIDWCKEENRVFLRQRIELRLINLYWQQEKYTQGLDILEPLLKEIRKIDEKLMLVELQLVESKIYHSLENLSKSKSSLTAARAAANSIYCPPALQAELDLMSGILQSEDKDYKTAYSYFFESFESFNSLESPKAIYPLKYMILSKIMIGAIDDVNAIVNGKYGLKYPGRDIDAMKAVAKVYANRSLKEFQEALNQYNHEIREDRILKGHISSLYETLLEQNLFRIVEPYSQVQIAHIAKLVGLSEPEIQNKLSEMILDKKFDGTLDQGNGCLVIFEEDKCDKLYENALDAMNNLSVVADKLFEKAKTLKANL
jgi:26S proteasome regulatory subunit N6